MEETMLFQEEAPAATAEPRMQVTTSASSMSTHSISFSGPELKFPQLNLRRDRATRVVVFDLAPLREQLRRNGISMESMYELSQEGLRELLLAWYIECIGRGGQCSAEITAAVREMRAANPTYRLVIRPVCSSSEGFKPAEALKPRHEAPLMADGSRPVGMFAAMKAKITDFLCEDGDIEVEKPYVVPSGPAMHLRPSRFRRAGLKEA